MIVAVTLLPWGLALIMFVVPRVRPLGSRLVPAAALPAALAALAARGRSVELDWLLMGTRLGVDDTAVVLLLFGSVVWTAAALYAGSCFAGDPSRYRFEMVFLVTMGAQLGLSTAMDAVSFYLLFWVLTLSCYGLVVHDGSLRARRAGRIYLVMAILGEGLLLPAVVLAVSAAGGTDLAAVVQAVAESPHRGVLVGLFLGGFAVKAGLPPLHSWLPLAHPAAPVPASAVLSGVLIKTGLLGWLRFLPLGFADLLGWGVLLISLGVLSAILGAAVGSTQRDAKGVLAYSSISQIGWMTLVVGLGLVASDRWFEMQPVLLLFMVHHGLAKAALFLGVGLARGRSLPRGVVALGLALPALCLAGAPFTTGASLKLAIKKLLHLAPDPLPAVLPAALTIMTFGTALVLTRAIFVLLSSGESAQKRGPEILSATFIWGQTLAWGALVVAGVVLPAFVPVAHSGGLASLPTIAFALVTAWTWQRLRWPLPFIPPGDILGVAKRVVRSLRVPRRPRPRAAHHRSGLATRPLRLARQIEADLSSRFGLALLYFGLLVALALAAAGSSAASRLGIEELRPTNEVQRSEGPPKPSRARAVGLIESGWLSREE